MCSGKLILLFGFASQTCGKDSTNNALTRLVDRVLEASWSLQHADQDSTMLQKPGQLELTKAQLLGKGVVPRFGAIARSWPTAYKSKMHSVKGAPGPDYSADRKYMVLAGSSASGLSSLPRTWSNRKGDVLRVVVPGAVWVAERPFLWNRIDVGTKMVVVKLSDGSVWVHSPVDFNAALREALAAVGPVAHIVSPNYEHVKYARQWKDAYPNATLYGCPGLIEKEKGIRYGKEVGQGNTAPAAWGGDIELCWFDCETNPFLGGAFFNEVVFLHAPSRTLIVTDLYWNYPANDVPAGTWLWKQGMDKVYLPFYKTFMIKSPTKFNAAMARVMAWEFDRLLPCHGDIVGSGGKRRLQDHMRMDASQLEKAKELSIAREIIKGLDERDS